MAAAAAAGPLLSDLPDEALMRILFFAPAREGATTAVLARRWRWLWRSCGAVNLDTRSFSRQDKPGTKASSHDDELYDYDSDEELEVSLRAAGEALAAADAPITRLSVVVDPTHHVYWSKHDLIDAVVNNPSATRRIEELHVEVKENEKSPLSFGCSLPSSETLRVARIIGCRCRLSTNAPPDAGAFPRLAELHLEGCTVPLVDLQRMADAAPQLETLHLESCHMPTAEEEKYHYDVVSAPKVACCRLVFPALAALVFATCRYQRWDGVQLLEIDAPRLRYFRYQGSVQQSDGLSLKPQKAAANLAQVDLDFIGDDNNDYYRAYENGGDVDELFWQFIRNFSTAKVLKIQLHSTMDRSSAVVADKGSQDELLGGLVFSLLERLELQAQYDPTKQGSTMVMLANLLHCCPVVRDLRLKLTKGYLGKRSSIDKAVQEDFNKSLDRFRKRRSPMVSFGGEDDGGEHEAPYIPGLSDESFNCLRSYLRRVSLHFCMDDLDCLGVQLAKFFAENAMVLEEMYVDDGSQKMQEHIGRSLSNRSAKRRNVGGIVILPR
jgi:hypothetical protein